MLSPQTTGKDIKARARGVDGGTENLSNASRVSFLRLDSFIYVKKNNNKNPKKRVA